MLFAAIVAACLLTLFAACGDSDEEAGGGDASPLAADLIVVARPEGPDGPVRRRHVECERLDSTAARGCSDLTAKRLAPVPGETACAEIYGGPATARVTGTLRGERIDARFSRVNACEIERWDRNVDLLGRPGRAL
jgi:hypothetical protein